MNEALRELYQEVIIDHNRHPRHHHPMADASAQALGFNRLCGDKLTVFLKIKDDRIEDISFIGAGCAISQASASLMTEILYHKSVAEAQKLFEKFHLFLTEETHSEEQLEEMNKLAVLAGVKDYPARVKCATLAWHTMESALKQSTSTATDSTPISTE